MPSKKLTSVDDQSMAVRMDDKTALVLRKGWILHQVQLTPNGPKVVGTTNLPSFQAKRKA
jgi:hypothetical protein